MKVIETTEATDVIADYFDLICDTGYAFDESEILRRLNAHAVDAESKHGKWMVSRQRSCSIECSECGFITTAYASDYCPRCGARMD